MCFPPTHFINIFSFKKLKKQNRNQIFIHGSQYQLRILSFIHAWFSSSPSKGFLIVIHQDLCNRNPKTQEYSADSQTDSGTSPLQSGPYGAVHVQFEWQGSFLHGQRLSTRSTALLRQRIRARRLLVFVGSSDDPIGATGSSVHIVGMKRAHDLDESAMKRLRRDGVNDTQGKEIVRQVADHYSARSNQTREQREASPIIHLKKLNNWIKSVLIQIYTQRGDTVLDMACGKGGDLIKWDKASIGYYVGIDIAEGSIEDARKRYNGDTDHARGRRDFGFPAKLICADCFEVDLEKILKDDGLFNVCSVQFAMHYSWDTEERARRALRNVSAILQPGGCFIGTMPDADVLVRKLRDAPGLEFRNKVYRVRFDEKYSEKQFPSSTPYGIQYEFHLEDAVDCPEWLVPFQCFKSLAAEYGLELVFKSNFHSFVKQYCQQKDFADLMRKLGALGDTAAGDTITDDEWDAAYIYLVFVFRKSGNKPPRPRSSRGTYKIIGPDEVIYIPQ